MSGFSDRAAGMFSGIKDRMNLPGRRRDDAEDWDYTGDDGAFEDDWDDFEESAFDQPARHDSHQGGYAREGYDDAYDEGYRTRDARTERFDSVGQRDYDAYGDYGHDHYDGTRPRLVSLDDVRAQMHAHPQPASDEAHRSPGLDFLFEGSNAAGVTSTSGAVVGSATATTAPTEGYASPASPGRLSLQRTLTTLSPLRYEEVEDIARALKAREVVVLQLRQTPSALSKRVLDFAFGASSMCEAHVDCLADKVYAITIGSELSSEELSRLRRQGIF